MIIPVPGLLRNACFPVGDAPLGVPGCESPSRDAEGGVPYIYSPGAGYNASIKFAAGGLA